MKRLFLLSALPLFIFSSCKKEVTEVTQVQKVDQAFSAVYNIAPGDWTTTNGGLIYSAELDIPELDNVIYQDGAVLVYLSFSGTSYYEALPQVFDGIAYGAIHGNGYVSIDMSALSGNTINPPGQTVSAKVILIDATRLALRKDVNLRDIQAVEKAFNIH
ncbi:hypothetical protein [Agriterribacter sp.]|uniref:hypothetical protein n=1 Tax=Agriterribacter sp. TaxID=2821509 RepID=UPI002CD0393B|nr:hypothetical protein [Agriterribacter sp.]HTN08164.1 hypothetical protein [Agriterribacter sp.]